MNREMLAWTSLARLGRVPRDGGIPGLEAGLVGSLRRDFQHPISETLLHTY